MRGQQHHSGWPLPLQPCRFVNVLFWWVGVMKGGGTETSSMVRSSNHQSHNDITIKPSPVLLQYTSQLQVPHYVVQ
jgi:hypothetical protein